MYREFLEYAAQDTSACTAYSTNELLPTIVSVVVSIILSATIEDLELHVDVLSSGNQSIHYQKVLSA